MSAGADFLDRSLKEHSVVVFGTQDCPFCHRALIILSRMTPDVKVYYIDSMKNGAAVFNEIERFFDHHTVPAIFVRGKFVGGCDDMEALKASGVLEKLLRGAMI